MSLTLCVFKRTLKRLNGKVVSFVESLTFQNLENEPDFGGYMLWDAAWDQQNVIDNRLYSDYIADIIGEDYPTETPTTPGPTHKTSTEGPTSPKPSTPPPTPEGNSPVT